MAARQKNWHPAFFPNDIPQKSMPVVAALL
jgi:hypothetical protein